MSAATTVRNFDDATVTITDDGGNSHSVPLLIGDLSISGLQPSGREGVVAQTQGAYIGDRLGDRVPVEITVNAYCHRLDDDFYRQAMGTLAGFVSTTADIGDGKRNNLQIDESYSSDSRVSTYDDCRLTAWSYQAGKPGQVSMTFECIAKVVIDGHTYVSGR